MVPLNEGKKGKWQVKSHHGLIYQQKYFQTGKFNKELHSFITNKLPPLIKSSIQKSFANYSLPNPKSKQDTISSAKPTNIVLGLTISQSH